MSLKQAIYLHLATSPQGQRVCWSQRACGFAAADIAADLLGKQGFENHLASLTRKKEELQKRIDVNKAWTVAIRHSDSHIVQPVCLYRTILVMQDMFDKDVGPFQQKYIHLVEDIHGVYGTAKEVNILYSSIGKNFSRVPSLLTSFAGCSSMQRAYKCW